MEVSLFQLEYTVLSIIVGLFDLALAYSAFKRGGFLGKSLGATCVGCCIVDISYLLTTWCDSYFINSCMSSVYFVCVDLMLIWLVAFLANFTKRKRTHAGRVALKCCTAYAGLEVVLFAINPFKEIVISYVPRATAFAKFAYDMHALYYVHLFFCYGLVVVAVVLLIHKMVVVPREYKRQYIYSVVGIVVIVLVNAIFLFAPGLHNYNFLDYSIIGYSVAASVLYWACFQYAAVGMMDLFKTSIFENLDQGLLLFDFEDKLILHNEMADKLLSNISLEENLPLRTFEERCGIFMPASYESFVVQCYTDIEHGKMPLRCDFRTIRNRDKRILGHLFMFSNATLTTDPLTGFHNWESFTFYSEENKNVHRESMIAVACDIMNLSFINGSQGRHVGDRMIKDLSDILREKLPQGSYFVRGQDAVLIALCLGSSESDILEMMKSVSESFESAIQYSVSVCSEKDNLMDSIQLALKGLKQKKLLNKDSSHSVILNSLVQALQACDSDTEEHVRRTQMMGSELGKRLGLSDVEQGELSLLCLLHDIGKIGVPLEILNKPGKLSADEWAVMRTHPLKGYQIANSSPELCGIANMILHHHERWDGKGYPDGLARESIPLLSRVISVVDAYDAMTNDRSYRKALPRKVALDELKRFAGLQFDPNIVSEFIKMVEKLPEEEKVSAEPISEAAKEIAREEITQGANVVNSFHSVHNLQFVHYVLDDENVIVSVDPSFEKLTGYTEDDVRKSHMTQIDLLPPEDRTEYICQMSETLANQPSAFFEHRILRKDGSIIYVLCFGRRYYDSAVRAGRAEITVADVADTYTLKIMAGMERDKVRLQQAQWEKTFRKDSLTGVLTRSAFKSDTEFKLLEGKTKVMLLMLDVDKFKNYNDTYGHVAGDEFLALVGQTLQSSLRHDDIAGRLGGDEFAAALFFKKSCTDDFMYERAQEIFDKINMTLKMAKKGTSLSMGAVISTNKLDSFNDLYQAADKLLYNSKETGRSRLTVQK